MALPVVAERAVRGAAVEVPVAEVDADPEAAELGDAALVVQAGLTERPVALLDAAGSAVVAVASTALLVDVSVAVVVPPVVAGLRAARPDADLGVVAVRPPAVGARAVAVRVQVEAGQPRTGLAGQVPRRAAGRAPGAARGAARK